MPNFSEVAHAKNVANFEDLISYCTGYGPTYNPCLNAIKVANMNTLKTSAINALASLSTTTTVFKNATNSREILFDPIRKLTARIMNALTASGVPAQTMQDAFALTNKLPGKRGR